MKTQLPAETDPQQTGADTLPALGARTRPLVPLEARTGSAPTVSGRVSPMGGRRSPMPASHTVVDAGRRSPAAFGSAPIRAESSPAALPMLRRTSVGAEQGSEAGPSPLHIYYCVAVWADSGGQRGCCVGSRGWG
jgi:hypothetical protein